MFKKLYISALLLFSFLAAFGQRHDSTGNATQITPYKGGIAFCKYLQVPPVFSPSYFDSCRMLWDSAGNMFFHDCNKRWQILSFKDSAQIQKWGAGGSFIPAADSVLYMPKRDSNQFGIGYVTLPYYYAHLPNMALYALNADSTDWIRTWYQDDTGKKNIKTALIDTANNIWTRSLSTFAPFNDTGANGKFMAYWTANNTFVHKSDSLIPGGYVPYFAINPTNQSGKYLGSVGGMFGWFTPPTEVGSLTSSDGSVILFPLSGTGTTVNLSYNTGKAYEWSVLETFDQGIYLPSYLGVPSTPASGNVIFSAANSVLNILNQDGFYFGFDESGLTGNYSMAVPNHNFTGDRITTATTTNLNGYLSGNGANISASTTIPYSAITGGPGGTVTSVTAGTGLSGGTITSTGTISMPNVGTPGTYGSATQIPVTTTDAQGRVTSVTNTFIDSVTFATRARVQKAIDSLNAVKGNGTVTQVSSNNLSPLFTTSVATPTTTPTVSYSLSNAGAHTFFGNFTGSTGAPSYSSPALASGDFANQGTTTTVLHGNASGNPAWGSVVNADIAAGTIDLTTKVTAVLPKLNGGTGVTAATTMPVAGEYVGWNPQRNIAANSLMGGFVTVTTGSATISYSVSTASTSNYTGTMNQFIVLPDVTTLVSINTYSVTQSFQIVNNTPGGTITVNTFGGVSFPSIPAQSKCVYTCILNTGTGTGSWSTTPVPLSGGVTTISTTDPALTVTPSTGNAVISYNEQATTYAANYTGTVTINCSVTSKFNTIFYFDTAQAGNLYFAAPTGTYTPGQHIVFACRGTAARTFTFNAVFVGNAPTLPAGSTGTTEIFMEFIVTDRLQFLFCGSTTSP